MEPATCETVMYSVLNIYTLYYIYTWCLYFAKKFIRNKYIPSRKKFNNLE